MCPKKRVSKTISHFFKNAFIASVILTILSTTGCKDAQGPGFTDTLGESPTPVQVIETTPAEGAEDVELDTYVQAIFNAPIITENISDSTFVIRENGAILEGILSPNDSAVTFYPANEFNRDQIITATLLSSSIVDTQGNTMEQDFEWSFTTREATTQELTPPAVTSTQPSPGTTDVSAEINIQVHFNKALSPSTVNENTFFVSTNNNSIAGSVTYQDTTAIFSPSESLTDGTVYTATVTEGIRDLYGNIPDSAYKWNFTTKEVDRTPPQVISTIPRDNEDEVLYDIQIKATFSEKVDPATINNSTFMLQSNNRNISGTVRYEDEDSTAIFIPSEILFDGTVYTATITGGIRDLHGNVSNDNYKWYFITKEMDRTPPHVVSTSPQDDEDEVLHDIQITATFSEKLDPNTINSNTFKLRTINGNVTGTVRYKDEDSSAVFHPSENLKDGTVFTATITDDIRDLKGNTANNNYNWNFTTKAIDRTPPRIVSTNPSDDEDDVSDDIQITVTFNESMDASTINKDTFGLYEFRLGQYRQVAGLVSYSGNTAKFTPLSDLRDDQEHVAIISSDVTDLAGNQLGEVYRWGFSTEDD